jgi:hypothetical protein
LADGYEEWAVIRRALILLALSAPQIALAEERFDCEMGTAYSVDSVGAEKTVRPIDFGSGSETKWKFSLVRGERSLTVEWPDSPMQMNGTGPLVQTGPSSYASFIFGKGPCLFTEGHCGANIHYAAQADGSLTLQILPVAMTKFEDGHREPFVAFIKGRCEVRKDKK